MQEGLVLGVMEKEKKPFSVQEVVNHLQKDGVKKAAAQRGLDELVQKGTIIEKVFGKNTKIYFLNQEGLEKMEPEEMWACQAENRLLQQQVTELSSEVRDLERKLKALQSKKTVPELKAAINGAKARIAVSEERLKGLRGPNAVDEKKMATVEVGFQKYTEAWTKYKRVWGSLWDPVSEGMGLSSKKERDVLSDMGVDTDNDAGVDLKEFRALLSNKRARR